MNRIAGTCFALLFFVYGYLANDIQLDFWAEEETFNARTFPLLIAAGGILFSLAMVLNPASDRSLELEIRNPKVLMLILLMLAYSFLLDPVGFPMATAAFLTGALVILGETRWPVVTGVSLGVTGTIWLMMHLLGIYLDPGLLRWPA